MAEKALKVHLTGPHAFASVHNEDSLTLASFLTKHGWDLVDTPEDADAICAVELPVTRYHLPQAIQASSKKGLLIVQEPSVVRPFHNKTKFLNRFSRRFEVGRASSSPLIPWPALYLDQFEGNSKAPKLPRACLISSNKVSFVSGELYSLRRRVVDANPKVDLFGAGWNSSKWNRIKQCVFELYIGLLSAQPTNPLMAVRFLSNVRHSYGPVADKLSTNSNYKATVVIENSREYMSEKLLEAIAAGSIPVYVGPDVTQFGIPEEIVVQVNPDVQSVNEGVAKALAMDYGIWSQRCERWLDSKTKAFWSLEKFWINVHDELTSLACTAK